MTSLAARLQEERDDNMGADAARAAAARLTEAAGTVESLAAAGGSALLAHALKQLNDGIVAAEELAARQITVAAMREADYAAGYAACLAAHSPGRGRRPPSAWAR